MTPSIVVILYLCIADLPSMSYDINSIKNWSPEMIVTVIFIILIILAYIVYYHVQDVLSSAHIRTKYKYYYLTHLPIKFVLISSVILIIYGIANIDNEYYDESTFDFHFHHFAFYGLLSLLENKNTFLHRFGGALAIGGFMHGIIAYNTGHFFLDKR
jgi:hypothetical protein